ncbi:MAG TPA: hypothetical protein VMW52_12030 [Phycisphaerae bacterium]|nr:hypothetical protein [Phycisphaerae bacterium]
MEWEITDPAYENDNDPTSIRSAILKTPHDWDGPPLSALVRWDGCIQIRSEEGDDIDIHVDSAYDKLLEALQALRPLAQNIVEEDSWK